MMFEDVETKALTLVASVENGSGGFGSGSGHDHHGLSASVPLLGVNWKKRRMTRQRRSSSSFNLLSFPPPLPPSSSSSTHVPTPLPARVSFSFFFPLSINFFNNFLCYFVNIYVDPIIKKNYFYLLNWFY